MVPADAFSLQECGGCAGGAQLRQYFLAGTASGEINPSSNVPTSGVLASAQPGGGLAATFTAPLPAGASAQAVPLIFASGAVYSNGYLRCAGGGPGEGVKGGHGWEGGDARSARQAAASMPSTHSTDTCPCCSIAEAGGTSSMDRHT